MGTLDTDGASTTAISAQTRGVILQCETKDVTHALTTEPNATEDGTGQGTPLVVARMVAFGEYSTDGTASTIKQRDYKDATDLVLAGHPRRLTPLECERLMSWPDEWTRYGRKEDGTEYELSDTARYRLCGNGVGSVCVEWFAKRLATLEAGGQV
jgi:site-specific DNA-cytosine methylase